MKIKIFNITKIFFAVIVMLSFTACENDDLLPEFTLQEASEQVAFLNSISDEYLLSPETSNNIAERFVWNKVDFGVPTEISYSVEWSLTNDFSTIINSSGTITENNFAVTVATLLDIALDEDLLGLDRDPDTEDPGNTGIIYFRVKAFAGTGQGQDAKESISETMVLNITLIEETSQGSGIEKSDWGIVGSAANDWGNAGPDLPLYTTSASNVFVAYVNLKDGAMKFRENNDWTNNFGDTGADGTLDAGGDDIVVTAAGDYKIVLDLNNNTYTIEEYSWGIVGSAWNDWGNAGPDAKLFYDYETDTFKVGVKLMDGAMKIRFNNAWDVNFGDTGADGTLEAGGDDIITTAGFYMLTVNFNDNTYTLEASDLFGIVGSGYNDWGNAGPDFTFTQVNFGIWIAQNVTLIDGAIKFRVNEAWDTNFGDTGADGTLDAGGDDIVVTAGTYDIFLDFNTGTYTMITK